MKLHEIKQFDLSKLEDLQIELKDMGLRSSKIEEDFPRRTKLKRFYYFILHIQLEYYTTRGLIPDDYRSLYNNLWNEDFVQLKLLQDSGLEEIIQKEYGLNRKFRNYDHGDHEVEFVISQIVDVL